MRRHWKLIPLGLVAALALSGCLNAGTYPVTPNLQNGTISAGLWYSGGGSGCYWSRVDATGRSIANDLSFNGAQYVDIQPGDTAFTTEGCLSWVQVDGPYYVKRGLTPAGQFAGDGQYRVGAEIPAGVYVSNQPDTCIWERLNSFRGADDSTANSIIQSARGGVVTIDATDVGFGSEGCGVWTKVG